MQNLKVSRKPLEVASLEKTTQAKFNSRTVAKRIVTRTRLAQLSRDSVAILVFGAKFANCIVTRAIYMLHEITYTVGIHGITELRLRGDFISFGDCNLAHVVVKAGKLRALPVGPRTNDAHPCSDAILYLLIQPVAHHHFAIESQSSVNKSRFAIAMRGLV